MASAPGEPTKSGDTLPPPTPPQDPALKTTCHCGRVEVQMPSKPTKLNECRCTVCYKYGGLWAYYKRSDVTVTAGDGASVVAYVRKDGPTGQGDLSFNRCSECGCMTHWWGEPPKFDDADFKMGVNCRMLPESAIEGVERTVSYC